MKSRPGIIYKLTNRVNGKSYIGQTKRLLDQRFNEHCYVRPNVRASTIQRAIQKYGRENFVVDVLEHCALDELNEREIYWIMKFDTMRTGYNDTSGGDYFQMSVSARAKISNALRGNILPQAVIQKREKTKHETGVYDRMSTPVCQYAFDGSLICEHKSIHAASRSIRGDSSIASTIHNCCNGKQKQADGFVWRYRDENFNKFDITNLRPNSTSVIQYDKQMNKLHEYKTIKDACTAVGASHSNIVACCKGRIKTSKGFIWRYDVATS